MLKKGHAQEDVFRVLTIDDNCLYVSPLDFAYTHLFEYHHRHLDVVADRGRICLNTFFNDKPQRFRHTPIDNNNISAGVYNVSNWTAVDTPGGDILSVFSHFNENLEVF